MFAKLGMKGQFGCRDPRRDGRRRRRRKLASRDLNLCPGATFLRGGDGKGENEDKTREREREREREERERNLEKADLSCVG